MSIELVYGIHAVETLLQRNGDRVTEVLIQAGRVDKRMQEIIELAQGLNIELTQAPRRDLDEMLSETSGRGNHQGVIAKSRLPQTFNDRHLPDILDGIKGDALILVLDGVTDPHNLGACLRSADAAGAHAVIAPKDKSATLNGTACKVACGAAEVIPFIQVTNLARTLKELQQRGMWITGTAGESAVSVFKADLTGSRVIVMGAEGKGMRRLTREGCDELVFIPMAGEVSSLNVSVATGVCLFEVVRQRAVVAASKSAAAAEE